jgi:glutathione S-transferase
MKLYVLPPSPRVLKVIALNNHLGLDCEMQVVDLSKDEHLTPAFAELNPNKKMPVLDDDRFHPVGIERYPLLSGVEEAG